LSCTANRASALRKRCWHCPKPYRLVLILRDMEQLDTREVAEVMEISEDTVKMRLHRARVFVRNELEKYFRGKKVA
jgi:RNA polymerase sigma-70 factor (ECF subfamily)